MDDKPVAEFTRSKMADKKSNPEMLGDPYEVAMAAGEKFGLAGAALATYVERRVEGSTRRGEP